MIDCVYNTSKTAYSYCDAYNTTFVQGYNYDTANKCNARNCLFLSGNGQAFLYNCISTSAIGSATDKDGKCQFGVAKSKIGYEAGTYRPLPGSLAVDAGNDAYYAVATNGWTGTKKWWQTFITGKDYAGGEGCARRRGASIDVGAGEVDPTLRMRKFQQIHYTPAVCFRQSRGG